MLFQHKICCFIKVLCAENAFYVLISRGTKTPVAVTGAKEIAAEQNESWIKRLQKETCEREVSDTDVTPVATEMKPTN